MSSLPNLTPPAGILPPIKQLRSIPTWQVDYLVSNRQGFAPRTDLSLLNPWGIVIFNNELWVVNNSGDTLANFDFAGNQRLGNIRVRDSLNNSSFPSGLVVNTSGAFPVSNGTATKSAIFITCTEHGTVHAATPIIDPVAAPVVINKQITGRVHIYTGVAVADNLMYVADFFNRSIDVFDTGYNQLSGFQFVDTENIDPIPINFSPFNIVYIGEYLYVLWARRNPDVILHSMDGVGQGYISVFRKDGTFVCRFATRGELDAPWAMIPAPIDCGFPPGALLIGNHGNGRILVYDCQGRYCGPLLNQSNLPIVIEGLWGLAFDYSLINQIFFSAAPDGFYNGVIGRLSPSQRITII